MRTSPLDDGAVANAWGRFQDLLTTVKPGQRVTVNGLAARSGVAVESVETVLQALTRAELFLRVDAVTFVRGSLAKSRRCA
jgi:hypothetical protein